MAPPGAPTKPSWVGQTPLLWQERCPDVWSLKQGLSQKLCCFCLSQKLCCFCSRLAHPQQSVSRPVQTGLRGTRNTRWLPHLRWWSEPCQAATSPLMGKVPVYLQPKTACPRICVAFACPRSCVTSAREAALLLQSVHSPSTVLELICADSINMIYQLNNLEC